MHSLYNLSILLYSWFLEFAAFFHPKARAWIQGRKGWKEELKSKLSSLHGHRIIWFHCASLGEFEQGRPLIEEIRKRYPEFKVIVSFFSPSGYTIRKNYPLAEAVVYLPADIPSNARFWVETVRPEMAFFIKYEYWFNFLKELHERKIPVIFASAVFRQEQLFFQWYGSWFRSQLEHISWFFVQNEASGEMIQSLGFENVTISGDTRFDRVSASVASALDFPLVKKFVGNNRIIFGGSTWPEDEAMLIPLIRRITESSKTDGPIDKSAMRTPAQEAEKGQMAGDIKFILATHDVSPARMHSLESSLGVPSIRYSDLNEDNADSSAVLIIDTIGILSQLYQFARIAFIGGAFGSGLHNILEAVAFGVPVFFGPKHKKFWEASALIDNGGAFQVKTAEEFSEIALRLMTGEDEYKHVSEICLDFVKQNRGGTNIILDGIKGMITR